MRAKITADFLRKNKEIVSPKDKPFEIYDTELKGFTLRVQPSGVMTYLVRYRMSTGKQTRHTIGSATIFKPDEARAEAKSILAGVALGEAPSKPQKENDGTLEAFLDDKYKPWVLAHRKDATATLARLKSCYEEEFYKKQLTDLNAWIVEKWRTARLKDGIKPATVNRDLTALKAALSKAVEWGMLATHPLAKVKPSRVDGGAVVRFLDRDEERRLYQALDTREETIRAERDSANAWRAARGYTLYPDLRTLPFADHLKPLVVLSLNTGMRWGEITHLEWADVDTVRKFLSVRGDSAKSGKTRHLPLNDLAAQTLKDWRTQQTSGRLVFPGKEDEPLDNVKKSWNALLDTAGIQNFRWHDLRHHFASRLVMAGVDLNTVRELLGHTDLKMTLRYAHLAPEHKAAAVARLLTFRQSDGDSAGDELSDPMGVLSPTGSNHNPT